MTENRNHGFNIRFYFGVILLIVAAVLAFFALKKVDVDTLVKDNKFFTHYSAKDGDQLAVKITQITANPIFPVNNGSSYVYIIEYEDEGKEANGQKKYAYVGLELDKETAQKLVAKNSTLPDNPEIMAVTLVDSSRNKGAIKNYDDLMLNGFKSYNLVGQEIEYRDYLSISDKSSTQKTQLIIAAGLTLAGLVFIGLAFWKRKKVSAAYDEIYAAYPELRDNLDLLKTNATYVDDEMFVYIYKNHFFTTWSGLEVYDITKANRVYHYQVTHKKYGVTTNIDSFLIFLSDDRSYKGKKTKIAIHNIGEETDDFLQSFFHTVAQEFPNVAVGYENNRPF